MSGPQSYRDRVVRLLNASAAVNGSASHHPDRVVPVSTPELASGVAQIADPAAYRKRVQAALANSNPKMSTAEDWGRTAVSAIPRVAAGFAGSLTGMAPSIRGMFDVGAGLGAKIVGDPTGAADLKQRVASAQDAVGNVAHAIGPNVQSLAGFGPTQGQYDQTLQHYTGPYHEPQSLGARIVDATVQNSVAALFPGSWFERGMRVLVPTVTGQTAYELAPDKYKNAAKTVATLVGGGAEGVREAQFKPPYATVGGAMPGVTDEQLRLAQAIKDHAAGMGWDLTNPEALQQATNGGTDTGRLLRHLESSRTTAPRMKAFFANRPQQIDNAVKNFTSSISPDMPPPGVVGVTAQNAGQGALDFVRKSINEAASPYYDALQGEHLPPDQYAQLAQTPAYQQALADVRNSAILNDPIKRLADHNLAVVNEVVKRLDRNANAAAITQLNPLGDNQIAAANTSARSAASDLAEAVSPNWRAARGTVARGREAILQPLEAGPVGNVAATPDVPTQTGTLYPQSPPIGAPAETAQAINVLNSQDPNVARNLTRQHMEMGWNEANRDLQGGANQFAGAKYIKSIAGNDEQAATLRSGLGAIDPSGALAGQFNDLAEALRATGQREPIGSRTSFNDADTAKFNQPPLPLRLLGGLMDPFEWGKNLNNWSGGMIGKQRLQGLADILLDPDLQGALSRARDASALTSSFVPTPLVVPAINQFQGSQQ